MAVELISNNVLEPWLYGSSVGVSSFALIVAAVFWTWLWGTAGLFLAIPLTVCLVVMGRYIPQLEFLSVLLSDQPGLKPEERFYQRLLSNDAEDAEDLLEEELEQKSLLEVCDTIVLPALRFAEQDHDRGAIDENKRRAIVDEIGELADDLREPDKKKQESSAEPPLHAHGVKFTVLCLPAADRADEVGAQLFGRLIELRGLEARAASITALKGEMLDLVDEVKPDAICISATPPAAVIHARYLCKKLRGRVANIPIIVGLWNAHGDMQRASHRLASAGASKVITTYAAGMEELAQLVQAVIEGVQKQRAVATAPAADG